MEMTDFDEHCTTFGVYLVLQMLKVQCCHLTVTHKCHCDNPDGIYLKLNVSLHKVRLNYSGSKDTQHGLYFFNKIHFHLNAMILTSGTIGKYLSFG